MALVLTPTVVYVDRKVPAHWYWQKQALEGSVNRSTITIQAEVRTVRSIVDANPRCDETDQFLMCLLRAGITFEVRAEPVLIFGKETGLPSS